MKKISSRIFALLLSVVMLASLFPAAAFAEGEENLVGETISLTEESTEQEAVETDSLEKPIRVVFDCDPPETVVTVYTFDEEENKQIIEPEDDGAYLLLPGEYFYDAECEGYETVEMAELNLDEAENDQKTVLICLWPEKFNDIEIEAARYGAGEEYSIESLYQSSIISSKLKAVLGDYPSGSYWTSSFDGGSQCYGFAKLVVTTVFGYNGSKARSWRYNGTPTSGMVKVDSVGSCTASNVKTMLSKARPGDVLQFDVGSDGSHQHSMVIYSLSDSGAQIYECNWYGSSGSCKVTLTSLSFSEIATRQGGTKRGTLTLLRSSNYDEVATDGVEEGVAYVGFFLNHSGKNYLLNSDFSRALDKDYWDTRAPGVATMQIDSGEKHNGHNSLKIVYTSAGTMDSDLMIQTLTQGNNSSEGYVGDTKAMTLSFWAKSSVPGTKIYFRWGYESTSNYRAISLGTSWQKYIVAMDKEATYNNYIHPYIDSAGTVWLSEMQLEDGVSATDFVPEDECSYATVSMNYPGNFSFPSAPTWSGHTFLGWYTAASGGERVTDETAVPNGNYTLYAHWDSYNSAINGYTVSYDANGGTGAPASQTKVEGEDLILSYEEPSHDFDIYVWRVTLDAQGGTVSPSMIDAMVFDFYHFKGWNTSPTGNGTSYHPGAVYTANENATLYAQWEIENTYEEITLPIPERDGYTFIGWNTLPGLDSGFTKFVPYGSENGSVVLFAIWKQDAANTYTITYDANGGTGAPANQTKTHDVALTLSNTKPTRADASAGSYTVTLNANGGSVSSTQLTAAKTTSYSFKNWNTAQDGSGTSYASGASYTENAAATLYAQWNSSTSTASVMLPTPTRDGYSFKGWNSDKNATSGMTGNFTPTANVTLYAIWEQKIPDVAATISAATVTGRAGETVNVPVEIHDNPGIIALQLNVSYNTEVLELVGVIDAGKLGTKWHSDDTSANPYVLTWSDDLAVEDICYDGEVAVLQFKICEDTEENAYPINLELDEENTYNNNFEPVAFHVKNGSVIIRNVICGDVNDDGKVNGIDRTFLSRHVAKWSGYGKDDINYAAADVNGDGKVNGIDRTVLARHIAKWTDYGQLPYKPNQVTSPMTSRISDEAQSQTSASVATITASTVSGKPGETVDLTISIENNPGLISMQLNVGYDASSLRLLSVTDAGKLGTQWHGTDYSANPYFLTWGDDLATKDNTYSGPIVTMHFQILEDAAPGNYPITISYDEDCPDIYNSSFESVHFELKNGSVQVQSSGSGATVYGTSISASGNVGLNIYLSLSDELAQDENSYVTLDGEKILISQAETRQGSDGLTLYRFSVEKAAAQMNEEVLVRVYNGEGTAVTLLGQADGEDYTETGYSTSVLGYIEKAGDSEDGKLLPLLTAMSDYGSYAQLYFNYDPDNRAPIQVGVDGVKLEDLASFAGTKTAMEGAELSYLGSSLSVQSNTVIRHYFTLESGQISDYTFTVDGTELTPTLTSNGWMIELSGVPAALLDLYHHVVVSKGEERVSEIDYCALTYAYNTVAGNTGSQALHDLVKALYLYNQAANHYFGA